MNLLNNLVSLEVLGILFCIISLLILLLSFIQKIRIHCLKISSMLFVISLSLFSNNEWVYVFSVFIVATSITKLEFLQNIAAIFRGSKEYFDYQKETLNRNEIENKLESEMQEIKNISGTNEISLKKEITLPFDLQHIQGKTLKFVGEQLALIFLEGEYEKSIEKNVRYVGDDLTVEIDGVISGDYKTKDKVFEIKVLNKLSYNLSTYLINSAIKNFIRYAEITGHKAEYILVFVTSTVVEDKDKILGDLRLKLAHNPLNVRIKYLLFNEIGLPLK